MREDDTPNGVWHARDVPMTDIEANGVNAPKTADGAAIARRRRRIDAPARKSLFYASLYGAYATQHMLWRDYVVVSPTAPTRMYTLYKVARAAGVALVDEAQADDARRRYRRPPLATIRHADVTWDDAERPDMVNGRCVDISKTHVDKVFERYFGYATRLDPTVFKGRAVIKSERNFGGGGRFVDLPIEPASVEDGHIYQRLVDNEIAPGVVKEFRVAVIGNAIADVVVTTRAIDRRLRGRGSGALSSETVRAEDAFSADERAKLLAFCAHLGLEFGELDVLPHVPEDRIYVLDANKTPTFLTQASAFRFDRAQMVFRRAVAFRRFLKHR